MANNDAQQFEDQQKYWEGLHEELGESSSSFIFLKSDRTRVRLVAVGGPGSTPDTWYSAVENNYRGVKSQKYLLPAYIPPISEDDEPELKALLVPKGLFRDIIGLLREGYDLYSPEGHGLAISRSQSGGRTSYQVMPSPKPVAVPESILEQAAAYQMVEQAEEYEKMQTQRNQTPAGSAAATETQVSVTVPSPPTPGNQPSAEEVDW